MEIQQPSSVAQATALFTGLTQNQVRDTIKRIYPYPPINTNLSKNIIKEAVSSTGTFKDFREKDYIEAHRLLQGVITNPWQSIHDIESGKADPFYYDSGISDIQDIQQNTIGTVTGASEVNDPRLGFTENLLKMKIFKKKLDNDHSYAYLTNLFLTQVENGATYYQTQAMRQNEAFNSHMTSKRISQPPIDHHTFIKNVNMGNMHPPHNQRKRNIAVNTTPHFMNNVKRAKLDALHARFTSHMVERDHEHEYSTSSTPLEPPLSNPVSSAAPSRSTSPISPIDGIGINDLLQKPRTRIITPNAPIINETGLRQTEPEEEKSQTESIDDFAPTESDIKEMFRKVDEADQIEKEKQELFKRLDEETKAFNEKHSKVLEKKRAERESAFARTMKRRDERKSKTPNKALPPPEQGFTTPGRNKEIVDHIVDEFMMPSPIEVIPGIHHFYEETSVPSDINPISTENLQRPRQQSEIPRTMAKIHTPQGHLKTVDTNSKAYFIADYTKKVIDIDDDWVDENDYLITPITAGAHSIDDILEMDWRDLGKKSDWFNNQYKHMANLNQMLESKNIEDKIKPYKDAPFRKTKKRNAGKAKGNG